MPRKISISLRKDKGEIMKIFANLAVYLGIGFLLSYIINQAKEFLIVAIVLMAVGILLNIFISKRNGE